MAEPTEVDKAVQELAGALYTRYCEAVGGKAFDNKPLPNWAEFSTDPSRAKQAGAWVEVAREALKQIVVRPIVEQLKAKRAKHDSTDPKATQ